MIIINAVKTGSDKSCVFMVLITITGDAGGGEGGGDVTNPEDPFLGKYSTINGDLIWSKNFPDTQSRSYKGTSLTVFKELTDPSLINFLDR